MFQRALHAIEMPLAAVDELSDASAAPEAAPPKPEKNTKPKQPKKSAAKPKPPMPASPEKPKIAAARAKVTGKVQKKPAAASAGALKRPAATALGEGDGMPRKVVKYLYKADQKIGIKVNGSEKMTVRS